MRKACLMVSPFYGRNRIFDIHDKVSNRDNCLSMFYLLRLKLREHGFDLATQDIHGPYESDMVIYNDMPKHLPSDAEVYKSYLIIFESEIIRPDNWDRGKHRCFKKIFTWHDGYIDNIQYFKINFSHVFPEPGTTDTTVGRRQKLCALIAANKRSKHPQELYSERLAAIRWFETHHPDDFDLFGIGWDESQFHILKKLRSLSKLNWLTTLFSSHYPSYRGAVETKHDILQQYRFAFSYENAKDIPGYITEKIFDCFFSSCVPVYLGANNVTAHIPAECFIDKRQFTSYESLYNYMKYLDEREYSNYLSNIEKFLKSEKAYRFSAKATVETIVQEIMNG